MTPVMLWFDKSTMQPSDLLKSAWDVFLLFTIPIGGGIPAGVVLGKTKGLSWITMSVLYFFSDCVLAIVFEPIMKWVIQSAKKSPRWSQVLNHLKQSTQKNIERFGVNPGPFTLILIAFGVDPMTGRAVAYSRGHGFLTGWAIAITGDMFYFGLIMASTLWLNNILGDGTATTIIVMVGMIVLPTLIRKIRERFKSPGAV